MLLYVLSRPFAVALGLFVVLNAGASAARPQLGAGRLIVNLPLREPYLSLVLALFALCLLFPLPGTRLKKIQLLVLLLFGAAVAANIVRYYALIWKGLISTSLPVPFSVLVLALAVTQFLVIYLELPGPSRGGFLTAFFVPPAFFAIMAAHITTFGHTDYRALGPADAAVVLGARVNADGTVSEALKYRLLTGIELGLEGRIRYLIMTGGTGANGVNEAEVMARFAIERGVPPEAVILDREGVNTFASAVNCARICRRYGFRKVMVVSQYYHLARTKLIFERQGISVLTVPARVGGRIRKNLYYLLRETAALPYYYLCCTFGREQT